MKQLISSVPSAVYSLLTEFLARHPRFDVKAGAKGACKIVSYEFAKALTKRGIDAKLYHLEGIDPKAYPNAHSTWQNKPAKEWSHYVVKIGSTCFDLTARQFDSDLPQPYVCPMSELRKIWTTVEPDDFLNTMVDEFCRTHH